MSEKLASYVKEELLKIAKILESNYQNILPKSHKTKVRAMFDNLPVDWNLNFSWVRDRKVKDEVDLDSDDYTEDRDFRDRLKDIAVEGVISGTDVEIKLKVIWGESEGRNVYVLFKKDDKKEWVQQSKTNKVSDIERKIKLLGKEDEESFDLEEVYRKVLDKKRPEIASFLKSLPNLGYSWNLLHRNNNGVLRLEATLKDVDPEEIKKINDYIQEKNVDSKIVDFINDLASKEGIDKNNFTIVPSFKKKDGFSLLLRYS